MVALTSEGQLIFEEDREDGLATYGARLSNRNYLNGARHSVYYVRDNNTATLLVSCNFFYFEVATFTCVRPSCINTIYI